MKDYTLNFNELKMFILNYEIKDNKIIINYADLEKSVIPYSLENEKKILKKMKYQVINAVVNKKLFDKKIKKSLSWLMYFIFLIILNVHILTSENIISLLPIVNKIAIVVSVIMSFIHTFSIVINKNKLNDINKNLMFLNNEEKINNFIKVNQDVLVNVKSKTKELIEPIIKENIKLNLNDIDKVKYNELKQIINNINSIQEFDFNYDNLTTNKVLTKRKK